MSPFNCPLILTPLSDGRNWKLVEELLYETNVPKTHLITVPAGFITDFASVPRVFWRVIPPWGKYGRAAVVHDWLYKEKGGDRETADLIFLEAMTFLGVAKWKRYVMYWAVRCFGGPAWHF